MRTIQQLATSRIDTQQKVGYHVLDCEELHHLLAIAAAAAIECNSHDEDSTCCICEAVKAARDAGLFGEVKNG